MIRQQITADSKRQHARTPDMCLLPPVEAEAEAEAALIGSPAHEGQGCVAAGAALLQAYCHSRTQPGAI